MAGKKKNSATAELEQIYVHNLLSIQIESNHMKSYQTQFTRVENTSIEEQVRYGCRHIMNITVPVVDRL